MARVTIRRATLASRDREDYARHIVEHMAESGREGLPHFALSRVWLPEEIRASFTERLTRDLDEPHWGRYWLLVADDRVVGHLELHGGRVRAEMHRATVGMGILRAFTRQGHGARLVEEAARWARNDAGLRFLDLGVFANNEPARKLYRRMGFEEVGYRREAFRLDAGPVVDDVQMTLALR